MATATGPADDLDEKIDQVGNLAAATLATRITVVLDRSGSMSKIRSDVVGGLNTLITEQKDKPGACSVTVWQFDDIAIEKLLVDTPIEKVQPFADSDYVPRGLTPLHDAIGIALAEIEATHTSGLAEIIVVITDGMENASKEYSQPTIFQKIKALTAKQWVFSYLGANHDPYAASEGLGFSRGSTQSFAATAQGATKSFASVSRAAGAYRGAMAAGGQSAANYASLATTDFFAGVKEAEEDDDIGSVRIVQIVQPVGFDASARVEGLNVEQGPKGDEA